MRKILLACLARTAFAAVVALTWIWMPAARTAPSPALNWYKGNLHTHTINSDGDSSPDTVARWYKEHRYNFLVLSDHNFLTETAGLNSIFAAKGKFILVPGEEVTSKFDSKPVHVNAFQIRETIPPAFGHSVVETLQKNVDAIRAAGGLPSLNHPIYRWAITAEELLQIRDLKLFEVYNGAPDVNNPGGGGSPGLEEMWDIVLSAGRETYGIAVDDAHQFKVFGPKHSNPGKGWVTIQASELSTESVIEALNRGQFYASNGVELDEMARTTDGLRIKITQEDDYKYTTRFIGQGGKVLASVHGLEAEYTLRPGDKYVRATVIASDGNRAWVQPVFAR